MTTMYGIPNCDTIKKAKKWLDANNVDFTFHDYKKAGVQREFLEEAIAASHVDIVVNKRGTTFRKLDDAEKSLFTSENNQGDTLSKIIDLLIDNPSMIKRPILVKQTNKKGEQYLVGFSEKSYQDFIHDA